MAKTYLSIYIVCSCRFFGVGKRQQNHCSITGLYIVCG